MLPPPWVIDLREHADLVYFDLVYLILNFFSQYIYNFYADMYFRKLLNKYVGNEDNGVAIDIVSKYNQWRI